MEEKTPIEIEFLKTKPSLSLKTQFETVDSNLLDEAIPNTNNQILTKLRKQMEFYFGDSNLHNDKFLLKLLRQNEKGFIDLTIFLNFNKIKALLSQPPTIESKLQMLKQAIISSSLLKLNKFQTKVRRKIMFAKGKQQDSHVIYVENFPESITHEILARIFSKIGEVLHISLPKYTETQIPKGFAFIEFQTEEAAISAVEKYNNCIPSEFLTKETKGKHLPLNVIPKVKWLQMKQEYKTLKQKLLNIAGKEETKGETELNDNQNLCYIETKDRKNEDCLVLIKNIEKEIVKEDILVAVRHCCNPAYIDYKKGADSCVIRFENKTLRNAFFEKCFLRNLKIGKNLVIDYNDLFKKSLKFL